MKKVISYLRALFYIAAGLMALFMAAAFADSLIPQVTAIRLAATGGDLGQDEICANLLKGDLIAASEPIALKTARRELRFAETITWLAGMDPSAFVEIPRSQLFTELPGDQGPLLSCIPQKSANLAGGSLSTTLSLGYAKSRVAVTMRYSAGIFSTSLQRIEIGKPELVTPATPPPGEMERRMAEFTDKLDQMAAQP